MGYKTLYGVGFLLLSLFLAGCGRETGQNTPTLQAKATPVLTMLGEASSNLYALQSMEKEAEEALGIDLRFEIYSFEDANMKANQDLANRTGKYDLILQYSNTIANYVRNDSVWSVEDLLAQYAPNADLGFEKELFPGAWKEVGFYYADTTHYSQELQKVGYPFATNSMLVAYNKELFADPMHRQAFQEHYGYPLAPPTTWGQFHDVAEYFTQPERDLYGLVMEGVDWWNYYEYLNMLFGHGGGVMQKQYGWESTPQTPLILSSAESIEAAEYYLSLKPFAHPGYFTFDGTQQAIEFLKGKSAMAIFWSDYIPTTFQKDGVYDARFGFAPIPGSVSALAGGPLFINKETKYPQKALEYVLWLMQPDVQAKLVPRGLISGMRSAYQTPAAQALPYVPALATSLDRGIYMLDAGPDADMIISVISKYLHMMWNNELSPAEAMQQAEAEIDTRRQEIFSFIE